MTSTSLTSDETLRRLEKFGPNAVPWMLEVAIVLEMVLGKYIEAAVITVLLAFNAEGSVLLLDQSMLTGESVPIEAGAAVAEVTVTATSPNNRQGIEPPKEAIHGAIAIIPYEMPRRNPAPFWNATGSDTPNRSPHSFLAEL
jgi:hypothetical protein